MASALRSAILRHIRVPSTQALYANASRLTSVRLMSSHDNHITKEEVINRVLDVVKCYPKVDPSKVFFLFILICFIYTFDELNQIWEVRLQVQQWSICIVDSCLGQCYRKEQLADRCYALAGTFMIFTGKLIGIQGFVYLLGSF